MSTVKHTALPWKATIGGGDVELHDTQPGPSFQLYVYSRTDGVTLSEADAAFIVLACNSHYELLEALERINRLTSPGSRTLDEMIRDTGYACDAARAAIARATGAA